MGRGTSQATRSGLERRFRVSRGCVNFGDTRCPERSDASTSGGCTSLNLKTIKSVTQGGQPGQRARSVRARDADRGGEFRYGLRRRAIVEGRRSVECEPLERVADRLTGLFKRAPASGCAAAAAAATKSRRLTELLARAPRTGSEGVVGGESATDCRLCPQHVVRLRRRGGTAAGQNCGL